jgi:hypothetical protein
MLKDLKIAAKIKEIVDQIMSQFVLKKSTSALSLISCFLKRVKMKTKLRNLKIKDMISSI